MTRRPKAAPRLQPPPRDTATPVVAPPHLEPPPRRPAPRRRGRWITVSAFAVLATAAVAVFTWLPDWAERRAGDSPQTEPGPAIGEAAIDVAAVDEKATEVASPEPSPPSAAVGPAPTVAPAPAPAEPAHEQAAPPIAATRVLRSPPAAAAAKPADDGFAAAMSEGLTALASEEWTTAVEAFSRAAEIRPDAAEARDGVLRAETAQRLEQVATRRRAAGAAVADERWADAVALYGEILALDPTIGFAQAGAETAAERAALDAGIQELIDEPGRLATDEALAAARRLLFAAETHDGRRLREQRIALARHVAAYSTPVRAVLESDAATEITVYRVGKLGRFARHALELRPGTYTVVGSRRGFRDVRRQLVIRPGEEPPPLEIRCEEAI